MALQNEEIDKHIDWKDDKEVFKHIETQYWDFVENQVGDRYKVEYAADLNADKFGNGFGMPNQKLIDENQAKYVKHPWNFANL